MAVTALADLFKVTAGKAELMLAGRPTRIRFHINPTWKSPW